MFPFCNLLLYFVKNNQTSILNKYISIRPIGRLLCGKLGLPLDVVRQYSLSNPIQRKFDLFLVCNHGYDLWEEVPYAVLKMLRTVE